MSVDFDKKRRILVIHGVQRGDNSDQTQHKVIAKNLKEQLGDIDLPFQTNIFKYEDINDKAIRVVKKALAALTGNVISGWVVSQAVDLAGDVAIALSEGPTYRRIKRELKERILEYYENEEPLYLIAHSLGSIYAFDVLNDLMREEEYFMHNDIQTRPVLGLLTLGSPLALDLFDRDSNDLANLVPSGETVGDNFKLFRWRNYWDPTDPIVSGSMVGLPWSDNQFSEKFGDKPYNLGWDFRSRRIISGKAHLAAHTAYWKDPAVGLGIRQLLLRRR